jgi:hypothetical protein
MELKRLSAGPRAGGSETVVVGYGLTPCTCTFSFGTVSGIDVPGVPPRTSVPDGGMTVALLGLGLTSVGLLRRKLS